MTETVYAVASGKGGVGKTTTAVNLGVALARAGSDVALVDTDLGMANLAEFVDLEADSATVHDVLAGRASLSEATYRIREHLAVVPSGTDLNGFADTSPEGLGAVVADLREEFASIVLDVGAGVTHETVLPLGLADEVLLVSTPEPAAVRDAEKTRELAERVGGAVTGVVVTRTRPDTDVSGAEIAARVDAPLLGAVPEDPTVRESVYAGTPLVEFDEDAPAAVAFARIAAQLVGPGDPETDADDGRDRSDERRGKPDENRDGSSIANSSSAPNSSSVPNSSSERNKSANGSVTTHAEVSNAITEVDRESRPE